MKTPRPRCEAPAPLTELDASLTSDQRRTIDDDFDHIIVMDPYEAHAPSRRSDKELGEFLNLLDSLQNGNDRKETTR